MNLHPSNFQTLDLHTRNILHAIHLRELLCSPRHAIPDGSPVGVTEQKQSCLAGDGDGTGTEIVCKTKPAASSSDTTQKR